MDELPGSSEECREQLPEVLDSMFGISDSIAEYEEENNEEEQE
jgi:hypothetical protein